ncbi:hypothetical protein EIN_020190 [Entamoeba invadens IP1]|uniref:hypothetical protein n=1 Tax=Entamoeba invadens IP1 TaxID=370355 RepID=UPI0002C3E491|nr:hypothetical protein EIN_020190 [Entamoeba invadens IP1]ELP90570.1 hypothetical protein EIN_020190 [Entamoeba invadens IP1]|eukprot:XP_004257341.1 hypothetical protein EIN_020190 [Entamoeba invadens IP1]
MAEAQKANIVMFGFAKSGKTTFIKDVVDNAFCEDYVESTQEIPSQTSVTVGCAKFDVLIYDIGGNSLTSKSATVATYASSGTIHIFVISNSNLDKEANDQMKMLGGLIETKSYLDQTVDVMAFIVTKKDQSADLDTSKVKEIAEKKQALYFELDLHNTQEAQETLKKIIAKYAEVKGIPTEAKGKKGKKGGCTLF